MKYKVIIFNIETKEIVKSIPCNSLRQAEKVECGININIGDDYYTEIIESEPKFQTVNIKTN